MIYERYWEQNQGEALTDFPTKWPKLAAYIPKGSRNVIVDFGCGSGALIREMRTVNPNARYIGLDVSSTALSTAARRDPRAEWHKIEDGRSFPVRDGVADFVFSSEVIEHVYDTQNAFAEMARITRAGGRLLLTTPYHGFAKNLALVLRGFENHFDPAGPHIRFFTKRNLFRGLTDAGFQLVKHGYYGRFFPFSHSIYVVAEKI